MNPLDIVVSILRKKDELQTANSLLDTFAKYASSVDELNILGKCYHDIKQYNKAIKSTEEALTIAPDNETMYALRANLAKLYNHTNNPDKALFYININQSLNPSDPESLMERVFALFLLNRKDESEAILREMEKDESLPNDIKQRVKFNLGTYDLYKGKFQEGLRGFLLEGKEIGIWNKIKLPYKFWDGGIQFGKTIIIVAEGGIGDEIINIRFCKYLKEVGMNPIWFTTRKDLRTIFERSGVQVIDNVANFPSDTLWTYSMSLPIFLDLQPKDLWDGPYITPDPKYVQKWKHIRDSVLNIGIRWTGNPEYEQDLHRTVPLNELYNVVSVRECNLISLQRDEGADQILRYPDVMDLSKHLTTFEDTLGVIANLDLVVTSCTSIAHASSAMGVPTIVLVPITAYYTWASTTDESTIWYSDKTKILRQITHKSWKEPLKQLDNILSGFSNK